DGDDDDAPLDQRGRVVDVALADDERAAVDPDHDRSERYARVGELRHVHIEEQAVLTGARRAERTGRLGAVVAERAGVADPGPARGWLRWPPPQVPDGWGGVRHPAEGSHVADPRTADDTLVSDGDRGRWREAGGGANRGDNPDRGDRQRGNDDHAGGEPANSTD